MPQLNRKGIQTTPFLLILSAATLVLMAGIAFPAYDKWQTSADLGKAKLEAGKILSAAEGARTLGDVGSVQQIKIGIPDKYSIGFTNDSIILTSTNKTIEYSAGAIRYRGTSNLSGPGEYTLTVVHWTRDDETNKGKEFLLEALDP